MPPQVKLQCANIKSRKFPNEQCKYSTKKGEFCSRHSKHPTRFEQVVSPIPTRSVHAAAKKIQKWWKVLYGFYLAKHRTLAFFNRSICHNTSELATLEPIETIPRDYFFIIKENGRFWGFDIRTLVVQYEVEGHLENPYTKCQSSPCSIEKFRKRLDILRKSKKPLHFEQSVGLTTVQSWNLRVLDMCLRLDMLGYRVATHWFTDLSMPDQKRLYSALFTIWNAESISDAHRNLIIPENSEATTKLFKWSPQKISMSTDIDSVRRNNINVIERLISSATAQSDRTLGAMYTVMALCQVSYRCRTAYPWFI
jgi:hypothetical protein